MDDKIQLWSGAIREASRLSLPPLKDVLDDIGPLPQEALFLGVAQDGLPVLLNLHDSIPGSVAFLEERDQGLIFLKSVANTIRLSKASQSVQYAVVTAYPNEWLDVPESDHRVGVFPFYNQSSEQVILSLASWAHGNKNSCQSIVLLVDDLSCAFEQLDFDARQNLRWLFLRGPSRRVWPIVLVRKTGRPIAGVMEAFRTRIIDENGYPKIKEGDHWLEFWIPS